MYYVYILKSSQDSTWHYIGYTNNLQRRLKQHNSGKTKSIIKYLPVDFLQIEEYSNRLEAVRRELQVKSYKSGEAFKKLIQ